MSYFICCTDRPDAGDLRKRTRARHLEYMIRHKHLIVYGGPLQDDLGNVIGSLMVLDLQSLEAVHSFLAKEPYAEKGLFAEVRIHPMRQMVPETPAGLLEMELARERAREQLDFAAAGRSLHERTN